MSDLVLADPRGRQTGIDPTTGVNYREIPRSSYLQEETGQRTMVLDVRQPIDGTYELRAIGTANGNYTLDVQGRDRHGDVTKRLYFNNIPTERGAVHRYTIDYSSSPNSPLGISGGFKGDGHKPGNANAFLSYANPIGANTQLRAGETTFPLVIFYGASIRPASFTAILNDSNVSSRFTLAPKTFETVLLPLRRGSNTLALSVEGATITGQVATDTDRFVFWLP